VHRAIRRLGLSREAPAPEPIVRYEYATPGGLLHLDTKKLGRIGDGPGHRATGDRRSRKRGIGWEVLHVAIDDATRLVYAELLPDEKGRTTARFLVRALRWFRAHGVAVVRLLTDNGSPYRSLVFRRVARLLRIRPARTRPYHPQTNGKCERWIRPCFRSASIARSSPQRARVNLRSIVIVRYYNTERPHLGIGGSTPWQRFTQLVVA